MMVQTNLTVLLETTHLLQQSKRKNTATTVISQDTHIKPWKLLKHGSALINLLVNLLVKLGISIMLTKVTFWQL